MSGRSRSYKDGLYKRLADDGEALLYLQTALEDSQATFLVALRNVVSSRETAWVAQSSGLNREHLYRMLTETGDPKLSSVKKVLDVLGCRLSLEPVAERPLNAKGDSEATIVMNHQRFKPA